MTTDTDQSTQGAPFDGKSLFAAGFYGVVLFLAFDMILSLLSSPDLKFTGSRHGLTTVTLLLGHGTVLGTIIAVTASLLGLFSYNRRLPWHPGVLLSFLVFGAAFLSYLDSLVPPGWAGSDGLSPWTSWFCRFAGLVIIVGGVLGVRKMAQQARESWAARLALLSMLVALMLAQKSGGFDGHAPYDFCAFLLALVLSTAVMASIVSRFPSAIQSAVVLMIVFVAGSLLVRVSSGYEKSHESARYLAQWTQRYSGHAEYLFRLVVNPESNDADEGRGK